MVCTVTLNPCLDYIVTVEGFREGMVNRTKGEAIFPGGKGINVSLVLQRLGVESRALGFLAGFTGREIERLLREEGLTTDFDFLPEGMSRINVKIRSVREDGQGFEILAEKGKGSGQVPGILAEEGKGSGQGSGILAEKGQEGGQGSGSWMEESEINGQGPGIPPEARERLYRRLSGLSDGDVLVLAGSIPGSMPPTAYGEILGRLGNGRARAVVDATGELLRGVLPYRPFLVKPNLHELEETFHERIRSRKELLSCGGRLREEGARNVLISLGGGGAALLSEDGATHECLAPKGRAVNSVGAGDSMVAGFLAGLFWEKSYEEALLWGVAAGSACAFREGFPSLEDVRAVREGLRPHRLPDALA